MTTVDHGQRRSRAPGQGALERECRSCAITQLVAEHGSLGAPPFLAEDIDDDVVTISGPALDGLLVVPCAHVAGLDELSSDVRAHVLAALRRALNVVQERNPESVPRVEVTTEPLTSEAHVGFLVVPSAQERG